MIKFIQWITGRKKKLEKSIQKTNERIIPTPAEELAIYISVYYNDKIEYAYNKDILYGDTNPQLIYDLVKTESGLEVRFNKRGAKIEILFKDIIIYSFGWKWYKNTLYLGGHFNTCWPDQKPKWLYDGLFKKTALCELIEHHKALKIKELEIEKKLNERAIKIIETYKPLDLCLNKN